MDVIDIIILFFFLNLEQILIIIWVFPLFTLNKKLLAG